VSVKKTEARKSLAIVRPQVRDLLTRSAAFHSLPPDTRRQIAHDTTKIVNYLVGSDHGDRVVTQVDFPDFVSSLIKGVFEAIVDASIRQMEAYAELVAGVAKSLDEFSDSSITDKQARDYLLHRIPYFFRRGRKTKRLRVRLATSRQQLLARTLLMGINRIVVTDGKIRAKKR